MKTDKGPKGPKSLPTPPPIPQPSSDDAKAEAFPESPLPPAKILAELLNELAKRSIESLHLYEPQEQALKFHSSPAPERLVRGSNQSGKSLAAMVELARVVTGQDPFDKYPKKNGLAIVVAESEKSIGKVVWQKLGRPGAFWIIQDPPDSGNWRVYRWWTDEHRKHEAIPAPPLIEPRYIVGGEEGIAWAKKKSGIPTMMKFHNGWELHFFSSQGKPPQGWVADFALFDEEIIDESWHGEVAARLVTKGGKFVWDACPQVGSEALYALHTRVEDGDMNVEEFPFLLDDNPYIPNKNKKVFLNQLVSDEERRVRYYGEYRYNEWKVFPEYDSKIHLCDWFDIPADWTRFMVVDPGRQVCAVLFVAVPPPEHAFGKCEHVFFYDELYLKLCTAEQFGAAVAAKANGQNFFAFIIDRQQSQMHDIGGGRNIELQYSEALEVHKVKSEVTGYGFIPGSTDRKARVSLCHSWLRRQEDKIPKLQIFRTLVNFQKEIKAYHNKTILFKGERIATDDPVQKNDHLMTCFDAHTEVLTKAGWKFFEDVVPQDSLATVDLKTDLIEYQQPTHLIAKQHSGDMVQIKGRKLDAMVTPDHRMVVYPRACSRGYDDGRPVIRLAKDLMIWDRLKLHATWEGNDQEKVLLAKSGNGREVEVDAGDWAELLGWYVSEGCCARKIKMPGQRYAVFIAQTKPEGVHAIESLTARLPWNWTRRPALFVASSRQLWEHFSPLGHRCYDKRLPQWIKDASPRIINRFLDGAIGGDGYTCGKERCYVTTSRQLADDMQEMFIKSGSSASILSYPARPWSIMGRSGMGVVGYRVIEWKCKHGVLRDKDNVPNFSTVQYDGMVHCATVPNGTLIVRRNDKPMVAGNCFGYIAAYGPQYNKPKPPAKPLSKGYQAFLDFKRQMAKMSGKKGYIRLGPPGD